MIGTLFKVSVFVLLVIALHKRLNNISKKTSKNYLDKINNDEYISNNDETTELYPLLSRSGNAWMDDNITHYPKHHTSKINGEKTNVGSFFDKNNKYHDITSPKSRTKIPDRCIQKDDGIFCRFNDRIQNIPPKLIESPEDNIALNMVGDDGDIKTNLFDKNKENVSTGGEYFKGVSGYSSSLSSNLILEDIYGDDTNRYSI